MRVRPVTWLWMSESRPCTHRTQVKAGECCLATSAEWETDVRSTVPASTHACTYTYNDDDDVQWFNVHLKAD